MQFTLKKKEKVITTAEVFYSTESKISGVTSIENQKPRPNFLGRESSLPLRTLGTHTLPWKLERYKGEKSLLVQK